MRIARNILFIVSAFIFALTACTRDNEEEFYGCQFTEVSYAADIVPIMEESCYLSCHSSTMPSSGVDLSAHASLALYADPSNGINAQLLCMIKQTDTACESFWMPAVGGRISQCAIDKIESWVEAGAPNN